MTITIIAPAVGVVDHVGARFVLQSIVDVGVVSLRCLGRVIVVPRLQSVVSTAVHAVLRDIFLAQIDLALHVAGYVRMVPTSAVEGTFTAQVQSTVASVALVVRRTVHCLGEVAYRGVSDGEVVGCACLLELR